MRERREGKREGREIVRDRREQIDCKDSKNGEIEERERRKEDEIKEIVLWKEGEREHRYIYREREGEREN